MALESFDELSNFVNPAYASPEQLATHRAYAAALLKSQEPAKRPLGALANVIDALTAGLERRNADKVQSASATQNAQMIAALLHQQGGGQGAPYSPPQSSIGGPPVASTPPMGNPNISASDVPPITSARAPIPSSPKVWGDKEAEDAGLYEKPPQVASLGPAGGAGVPGGGQALSPSLPVGGAPARVAQNGQVDPRLIGALMANPMASPETRALASTIGTPKQGVDVNGVPTSESLATGVRPLQVAPGVTPGFRAETHAGPGGVSTTMPVPAPGYGGQTNFNERFQGLASTGRDIAEKSAFRAAGAEAQGKVASSDVSRAAAAPDTLKNLGVMEDTIKSMPGITFGPTAKLSNEALRVIGNYAPNLVNAKELAGADAIEKLNLGLAGALSNQLGLNPSDISRSIASVPGNEKSRAGTLALIDMLRQAAKNDQYVGTNLYQKHKDDPQGFQQARENFYATHHIINPITGNPIKFDAEKTEAPAAPDRSAIEQEMRRRGLLK